MAGGSAPFDTGHNLSDVAGLVLAWGDLAGEAVGTSHTALTAHLIMPTGHANDAFLQDATQLLHHRFDITHVTLQVMQHAFTPACQMEAHVPEHS